MPKFPFIIVQFCGGNERIVAGAADLHVAQGIWRALEDEADSITRYVILHEKQESIVAYEDNECESSTKMSWTDSDIPVIVNSVNDTCNSLPIRTT